jgi:hypothetical protein
MFLGQVTDNEYNISSTFGFEIGHLFNDETIFSIQVKWSLKFYNSIWLMPRTILS